MKEFHNEFTIKDFHVKEPAFALRLCETFYFQLKKINLISQ